MIKCIKLRKSKDRVVVKDINDKLLLDVQIQDGSTVRSAYLAFNIHDVRLLVERIELSS